MTDEQVKEFEISPKNMIKIGLWLILTSVVCMVTGTILPDKGYTGAAIFLWIGCGLTGILGLAAVVGGIFWGADNYERRTGR